MSQKQELKSRFESKLLGLRADWEKLKNESGEDAEKKKLKLKSQISDFEDSVKEGWDNLTEAGASKVNELIRRHDKH